MNLSRLYGILVLLFILTLPHIVFGQVYSKLDSNLVEAVRSGDIELVRSLLGKGANPSAKTDYNWPCIILASFQNFPEIVKTLVEHGADVNTRKALGDSPLGYASANGDVELVKFLLNRGAEVNLDVQKSRLPLRLAINGGSYEVVKLLVENGIFVKNAFEISNPSTGRIARLLIEAGAEVDIRDSRGKTPLIRSAIYGWPVTTAEAMDIVDFARAMLENGVDVNAKDNSGNSALMEAVKRQFPELIQLLLDHGADKADVDLDAMNKILNRPPVPDALLGWWINKTFYTDLMNKITPYNANTGECRF